MLLVKALLQRVQRILLHALDGLNRLAVGLSREDRAGFDGATVEQNGASSTTGGVAADVGSRLLKIVPEEMNQQQS